MRMSDIPAEFVLGLREAQETYRRLVEGIPAILYVDAVDDVSSNIYTSPQVEEILGFAVEQWREEPNLWVARLHEEDRERVLALHRRSNETGEPFRAEYRLIAADGREVWIRDEAVLVRDATGRPAYWRGVMLDITDRKRAEEKLQRSLEILRRTMEDRRRLAARLEEAQEEERRRIAADIHDDTIQVVSAADLRAQALAQRISDPELRSEAEALHEALSDAVERLRHLLFELRPPALDRKGLVAALREYLEHPWRRPGPAVELEDRLEVEPPPELRTTLFRIAQEAITNVQKHAGATRLRVTVETADGGVRLRVEDDGRGLDALDLSEPEPGHLGITAMIERAELAGGRCRIEGSPGRGTRVECWVPLERPRDPLVDVSGAG